MCGSGALSVFMLRAVTPGAHPARLHLKLSPPRSVLTIFLQAFAGTLYEPLVTHCLGGFGASSLRPPLWAAAPTSGACVSGVLRV